MSNITAAGSLTMPKAKSSDELIAEAEAMIERADGRIGQRTSDLKRSLVAQTGKLVVGGVVAAAVTGLLIWRPWQSSADKARARRRNRRMSRADHDDSYDGARGSRRPLFGLNSKDSTWSIFSLIGLLWPLLPFKVPSPVGPKLTAFLMGLGLPIAPKEAEEDQAPPPMVEADFEPTRYFGRWFEIARLPLKFESSCAGDVTATYTPIVDGSGQLSVLNSCRGVDGGLDVAEGVARLADPASPAKLKVTFAPAFMRALPFVWADYWVLQVDSDYSYAVVGTPDRKNLWLLAREPKVDDATFEQMTDHAQAQGYDLAELIRTVQTVQG